MGNQVAITFTLDGNLFTGIEVLLFVLLGAGAAVIGWFVGWRSRSSRPGPRAINTWQRELIAWGVIGAGDKTLPVVEDVIRCWNRIASAGVIGLGIGVAL
ncbi:MAG TPA: hypothetical protein VGN32_00035, partial [Ktedonobacterales bacterium]|nr:hypothetical protein [Ktedonobacterales bacterium]